MTSGVSADELHCPTCGDKFTDLELHTEESEFGPLFEFTHEYISVAMAKLHYLRCPNGHKWTVETIWRSTRGLYPDRVQLGRYIGCE
jgi:hypothetical protein